MKSKVAEFPTTSTSRSCNGQDVELDRQIDFDGSMSEQEKDGKNVEPKRLQSRAEYPEKQSQSSTEEIASWSVEYPGVASEGCHPGFGKDTAMRDPTSSPKWNSI